MVHNVGAASLESAAKEDAKIAACEEEKEE